MIIPKLPFNWRLNADPSIPTPDPAIPARADFTWDYDNDIALVRQHIYPELMNALDKVYEHGSENLGATDNYDKFLKNRYTPAEKSKVFEIGPGTGWLGDHIEKHGAEHTAWVGKWPVPAEERHRQPPDKHFDQVIANHVLEHVEDPVAFLKSCVPLLRKSGKIFIVVPDCTAEVAFGDISMAQGQHLSYFTTHSIRRTFAAAGLDPISLHDVRGKLYVVGEPTTRVIDFSPVSHETFGAFINKATRNYAHVGNLLMSLDAAGQRVGIYCPMRFLPYCRDQDFLKRYRLFDDGMAGKWLDGVDIMIESAADILRRPDPIDVMLIMSLTYEKEIKAKIPGDIKVITLREMLGV